MNRLLGEVRPVVGLGEMRQPDGRRLSRSPDGPCQQVGAPGVREVTRVRQDAALEALRIWTATKHRLVMVRFQDDQPRLGDRFAAAGDGQPRSVTTVTDPAPERIRNPQGSAASWHTGMATTSTSASRTGCSGRVSSHKRVGTFAARAEPRVLRTAVPCMTKRGSSRMWSLCSWLISSASTSAMLSPTASSARSNRRTPTPQSTSRTAPAVRSRSAFPGAAAAETRYCQQPVLSESVSRRQASACVMQGTLTAARR